MASIALYGVDEKQQEVIDFRAILGSDFEQETEDRYEADYGFYWFDIERAEDGGDYLPAMMLGVGAASQRNETMWVAATAPMKKHPLLWVLDIVGCKFCDGFPEPADALDWFILNHYRTMPYRDYLKTDHWGQLRFSMIHDAGGRCQLCNRGDASLHVHHRTYERRGCETYGDLIVLCASCHATFHHKLPKE